MSGLGSLLQQVPVPTTQSTTTAPPLWLEQALSGLANAGGALAQTPYTPFPGPQVATPSDATQQSWQMAQNDVGKWQPLVNQGSNAVAGTLAPITPQQIQTFLNPYQDYITNSLNTNLQQNILPGIQDKFVSSGQSRSPQEAQVTGQAVYGANQAIGQSLGNAYQGALNSLLQERGQQQTGGSELGTLGALNSQLGIADTGQVAAAGAGQDQNNQANINTAVSNFNTQQEWPYQNLSFLSSILHGIPVDAVGQTKNTTSVNSYSPSPLQAYATGLLGSIGASGSNGLARGGRVGALSHFKRAA